MSSLIPFSDASLPASIASRVRLIDANKDIVTAAAYPTLSIKGKTFTLVQDSERRVLTKPDDPEEVLQNVQLAFLRINMTTKTFYKKKFTEDDSEGQRPDCYSNDGKLPSNNAPNKQAEQCSLCPHNEWNSRVGDDGIARGRACSDHARIAVADPNHLDKPMLLRAPPASLKPLKDALKMVKTRQLQYNEVVFRVGFERDLATPKLTFKPVGVLPDDKYATACAAFDSEIIQAILGLDDVAEYATPVTPKDGGSELDAALKARKAEVSAPVAPPAPAPAPVAPPAPVAAKPAAKRASKQATVAPAPAALPVGDDDLLGDLDGILGSTDD